MIALQTPVYAFVMPAGARAAVRVHGRVIARTWEQTPRYDIVGDDGRAYRYLPETVLEREGEGEMPVERRAA